jgi:uncharacterized protein (DUF58 family)
MMYGGTRSVQHTVPARGGRNQVLRIINDLLKQPHQAQGVITDLAPLFNSGLNAIKKRSLVFVVSDFISAAGWEKSLNLLSQRHEVIVIRLWDPREMDLPDIGTVIMEDSETGEQLYVDTHDKKFRQRFHECALQREKELSETFKRAGVDALPLSTEEDLIRAIMRFAAIRRQHRK